MANVYRSTGRCVLHICLWQMCLGALEEEYSTFPLANVFRSTGRGVRHISLRQMCLGALVGSDHV